MPEEEKYQTITIPKKLAKALEELFVKNTGFSGLSEWSKHIFRNMIKQEMDKFKNETKVKDRLKSLGYEVR
jgi:metal-responsive CopG/Arc/MetJ family transcriptional regulator